MRALDLVCWDDSSCRAQRWCCRDLHHLPNPWDLHWLCNALLKKLQQITCSYRCPALLLLQTFPSQALLCLSPSVLLPSGQIFAPKSPPNSFAVYALLLTSCISCLFSVWINFSMHQLANENNLFVVLIFCLCYCSRQHLPCLLQ